MTELFVGIALLILFITMTGIALAVLRARVKLAELYEDCVALASKHLIEVKGANKTITDYLPLVNTYSKEQKWGAKFDHDVYLLILNSLRESGQRITEASPYNPPVVLAPAAPIPAQPLSRPFDPSLILDFGSKLAQGNSTVTNSEKLLIDGISNYNKATKPFYSWLAIKIFNLPPRL